VAGAKSFTIYTKFAVKNGFTGPVLQMAKTADKLHAKMSAVSEGAKKFGGGVMKVGSVVAGVGAAALAAGAAVWKLADASQQSADDIQNTAGALGISTKALQEYRYVGIQAGLTTEDMDGALTKLTKNLGNGSKDVDNALYQIGLTSEQLRQAGPEKSLEMVADGFKNVKDPSVKAAVAMALFGKSSVRMVNALEGGADGIKATREEAEKIGYVMGGDTLQNAGDLNNVMDKLGATAVGLRNRLAAKAIPGIQKFMEMVQDGIQPGGKFDKILESLSGTVGKLFQTASPILDAIMTHLPKVLGLIAPLLDAIQPVLKPIMEMIDPILKIVENLMPAITSLVSIVSVLLAPILETIKFILTSLATITGAATGPQTQHQAQQYAKGGSGPQQGPLPVAGGRAPVSSQTSMVSSSTTTNKSELAITLGGQTSGSSAKLSGSSPGVTLNTGRTVNTGPGKAHYDRAGRLVR